MVYRFYTRRLLTRLLRPARYFAVPHERVLDASQLTTRRDTLPVGRVLLLGAGDNAAENALYLAERGHDVVVFEASTNAGGQIRLTAQSQRRREMISIIDWRLTQ